MLKWMVGCVCVWLRAFTGLSEQEGNNYQVKCLYFVFNGLSQRAINVVQTGERTWSVTILSSL